MFVFYNFIQRFLCRERLANLLFTVIGWVIDFQIAEACFEGIEGDLLVMDACFGRMGDHLQAVEACFVVLERAKN